MSKNIPVFLFGIFILLIGGSSCTDKCEGTATYTYYEPVYKTTAEIRSQVNVTGPATLENAGKIYLYGNYILINERGKGIHIINNSNPANPVFESFINIPGSYDMAVKNNTLYADNYVDLVAFDISNPRNVQFLSRAESVFPLYFNEFGIYPGEEDVVLTEWKEAAIEQVTVNDCNISTSGDIFFFGGLAMEDASVMPLSSGGIPPQQGIGGSMARFSIIDDYLYAVDMSFINVIDISNLSEPVEINEKGIGWGIETVFPFKDKLFIGTMSGMLVYDVTNRTDPSFLSEFAHVTACDPVVANDDYAFVTLRSGSECQGFTNQLDVLDITEITQPDLVRSFAMDNPHGLGLDGNTLFLCEGDFGLKIFDVSNVEKINESMIKHYEDLNAFDVIPNNGVLIMIGSDGMYQYDYSDLNNINLISSIYTMEGL